jgi:hypothetical protein
MAVTDSTERRCMTARPAIEYAAHSTIDNSSSRSPPLKCRLARRARLPPDRMTAMPPSDMSAPSHCTGRTTVRSTRNASASDTSGPAAFISAALMASV